MTHGLSYGSDATGLICGFLFTPGEPGRPVESDEAIAWLNTRDRRPRGDFLWLHLSLANVQAEKWIREHVDVPEHYFETIREGPGSTRIDQEDDWLVAVINDVIYEFSYDASQIANMWMCVNHDVVISMRLQALRSVDKLRLAVKHGETFDSSVGLLAHLLRDQADVLEQIARDAGSRVDSIEDDLLTGRSKVKRNMLGSMRRVFVRLRRILAPEPGAMFRLLNRPPSWFNEHDAAELRSATEEFSAVLNDLSALQERTKLLQEEVVMNTTEQTNRSVFLLTMVTVLALPINICAGLFGMNVGGIPLADDSHGFWIIAAMVVTFTSIAGWIIHKGADRD
jgi:zinc transporter